VAVAALRAWRPVAATVTAPLRLLNGAAQRDARVQRAPEAAEDRPVVDEGAGWSKPERSAKLLHGQTLALEHRPASTGLFTA
jgi:hypothetical protein